MRILYLDCGMGAAGDMLTAALLELLPDKDAFIEKLNALGIPEVTFKKETSVKCGIMGTHVAVTVNGHEEDEHTHGHGSSPAHHHSGMHEIEHIVDDLNIPDEIKKDVMAVYSLIAEAESFVHGVPVNDIHFHEVGTMDAVADITAVCMLMAELGVRKVIVSPIRVGYGQVKCAHGVLPIPAPATAHILRGCPVYGGDIEGELCTPTGAALLKYFADEFGDMPTMRVTDIGYGMGKKDFAAANCVRAMLGETNENVADETMLELFCNVDDMTAEETAFAAERIFESGARDVYTVPIGMKKSRPGTLIGVICEKGDRERVLAAMFRHTRTIGIRETLIRRYVLERSFGSVETPYGEVRYKESSGYGVNRFKYEHEDVARIAKERDMTLDEVIKLADDAKN